MLPDGLPWRLHREPGVDQGAHLTRVGGVREVGATRPACANLEGDSQWIFGGAGGSGGAEATGLEPRLDAFCLSGTSCAHEASAVVEDLLDVNAYAEALDVRDGHPAGTDRSEGRVGGPRREGRGTKRRLRGGHEAVRGSLGGRWRRGRSAGLGGGRWLGERTSRQLGR